jgi:ABC-type multidrug transport system ATPase subunit
VVSELASHSTVVLSTHQIEDVSALCQRVVCLDRGRVVFDGTPATLIARARGHVWEQTGRPVDGVTTWRLADGRYRVLTPERDGSAGSAGPGDRAAVEPTLEDAYLLLTGVERSAR